MDGYKKIIRSQVLRMSLLKVLNFVPDEIMIKCQYWIKLKRKLDLKNPQRYTEKIQWYKLYYHDKLMTQCVDKYEVRKYIEEKGCSKMLTRLYGVYDTPEEIDFDSLPSKFILKTTNESGTNIICEDKATLEVAKTKQKLRTFMNRPHISAGREWAYYNVKNKIVAEELLEDVDNVHGGINDYKFFCFNGKIEFVQIDVGRFGEHKRNIYDKDWKLTKITHGKEKNYPPDGNEETIFNIMKPIVEKLAEDFPSVRVDMYYVNDKVYFGELTFYSFSGYMEFNPDSFDYTLGKLFVLPRKRA